MRRGNQYHLSEAARLVLDTMRRFPGVPTLTLAKYLTKQHSAVFKNDDMARSLLRYYKGKKGKAALGRVTRGGHLVSNLPPVKMPESRAEVRIPYDLGAGLWLVLADLHVPFHNMRAIEAAVKYGQEQGVNGILLDGDIQDAQALGIFIPTRPRNFCQEVEEMIDFLDWLRKEFPRKQIVYKPGNHEDRLETYYRSHAPELANLPMADMEIILSLEERRIPYLGRKQLVRAGLLPIIHGHEIKGGSTVVNPARWLFLKWKGIAACAHFHRSSQHDETTGDGDLVTCWSFGCLCDLRPDYNPFANSWTHGFALVDVQRDGQFEVNNRRILPNGKVV